LHQNAAVREHTVRKARFIVLNIDAALILMVLSSMGLLALSFRSLETKLVLENHDNSHILFLSHLPWVL
jgi:hypothetical protein